MDKRSQNVQNNKKRGLKKIELKLNFTKKSYGLEIQKRNKTLMN